MCIVGGVQLHPLLDCYFAHYKGKVWFGLGFFKHINPSIRRNCNFPFPSAEVFPKLMCSFFFVNNCQKIIVRSTMEGCSVSVLKSI